MPAEKSKKPSDAELDRELDQALEATFPASDPIAIGESAARRPTGQCNGGRQRSTRRWSRSWRSTSPQSTAGDIQARHLMLAQPAQ